MTEISFVGIDPGLVHTGMVRLTLHPKEQTLSVDHVVIGTAPHAHHAEQQVRNVWSTPLSHVFIEAYRERGQVYGTNSKMRELMAEFRQRMPQAKVIDNTGSKQVVRPPLLKVLHLRKFPTTHHQDLQAAARILVYGMLKDPSSNALLTQVIQDHVNGTSWSHV